MNYMRKYFFNRVSFRIDKINPFRNLRYNKFILSFKNVCRRWEIFLKQTREAGKKREKRERSFAFL